MTVEIRASTILPAHREPVTLTTPDGLRLVGELALPPERASVATLVCLHPLPTAGGMMDSHVIRKASWRLPALADLAVLRFNTRGTASPHGTSEGEFGESHDEGLDLAAALAFVAGRELAHPWLLGWSFGTDVALRHGLRPGVEGAVLLSPPLRYATDADLDRWAVDGRPLKVLVPELDDFLRPPEAYQRFARVPHAEVRGVDGAKHLWVGEPSVRVVLDAVASWVLGREVALPTTWDGPYETFSGIA